jgi:hypothetical protein
VVGVGLEPDAREPRAHRRATSCSYTRLAAGHPPRRAGERLAGDGGHVLGGAAVRRELRGRPHRVEARHEVGPT